MHDPVCAHLPDSTSIQERVTGLDRLRLLASKPSIRFLLVTTVLLTILLACFAKTLGSYFLADDFGNVNYISKICEGDWYRLLRNFAGPCMELPAVCLYRPFLVVLLTLDYLIWKTNAFGYLLTNLLFVLGDALLVYAITRRLTIGWDESRSTLVSLLSAALFAANPLHCECVSWVVEVGDTACCFFYLASMLCFLRKGLTRHGATTFLGLLFFWIAMLTKEAALGLPALLAVIALVSPEVLTDDGNSEASFGQRLVRALRFSLPLWISAAIYFLIRYWALGTLFGGYAGSVGAELNTGLFARWTNLNNFLKIFYPFNQGVLGVGGLYHIYLKATYLVLFGLLLARLVVQGLPWRMLSLIVVWFLTSIAPIYQVWGLGPNLEGARFLFFCTVPLSIFLPVCLLSPSKISNNNRIRKIIDLLSAASLVCLVLIYSRITFENNIPWISAGDQTRSCLKQALALGSEVASGQKVVLLGLPNERNGAHMILNGITFSLMMQPPFSRSSYSNRFLTFAPFSYGDADLINAQRLQRCWLSANVLGLYVWDEDTLSFKPVRLDRKEQASATLPTEIMQQRGTQLSLSSKDHGQYSFDNGEIVAEDCSKGFAVAIAPLDFSPSHADFLQFDVARPPNSKQENLYVFWKCQGHEKDRWICGSEHSDYTLPACSTDSFQTVRLRLSKYWRWFAGGNIAQVRIEFPSCARLRLRNLQFISGLDLVPNPSLVGCYEDNLGINKVTAGETSVFVDARAIRGCSKVQLEIFKPNFLLENMSREAELSAVLQTFSQPGNCATMSIPAGVFPASGLYQIRAYCLSKDDRLVGEKSDPITIDIKK